MCAEVNTSNRQAGSRTSLREAAITTGAATVATAALCYGLFYDAFPQNMRIFSPSVQDVFQPYSRKLKDLVEQQHVIVSK